MRRALPALAFVLLVTTPAAAGPDPATVRRYGPAYRYPQAGWTVLHVEGEPFDRGYQHGRLMATEIGEYLYSLAVQQSETAPADGWKLTRTLVSAAFLRKFDREYLDEMRGIADGAAAAGATAFGRPVDLLDIAAMNVSSEYDSLDAALAATPTGLEGVRFPRPPGPKCCPPKQQDHCSAFAATGPATADGGIVFGHITMWSLYSTAWYNVWLDVKPAAGHRVVMQAFPGGIWSGMDYYQNSAGVMLTETTIRQTKFNAEGTPLANRARRAMQYADSIDGVVRELTTKNNGLYANDWLIGDAKTNEIASLELGTTAHRLRRSSKNEWLMPGTEGFYWGCNNTKDLKVRLDTVAALSERPEDLSWRPSDRDKAWLTLFTKHRGKLDLNFGKLAFTTPPLAAHPSLDAKVTTTKLAKELTAVGLFGPPYGRVWKPTHEELLKRPGSRPLVPNDWATLTPAAPAEKETVAAADISDRVGKGGSADEASDDDDPPTVTAWHGTLLPKTDADLPVTAGFAALERIVAVENAHKESGSKTPSKRAAEMLFRHRADYQAATSARPVTPPVSPIDKELDRRRWHIEKASEGVLMMSALRSFIGPDRFDPAMDTFGRAHAGKEITADEFFAAVGKLSGKDVVSFRKRWAAKPDVGRTAFAVRAFHEDLEQTRIVYGTKAEAAANKAAAFDLRDRIRDAWSNIEVPVVADTDAGDLAGAHQLLIGRPAVNAVAATVASSFPVQFGPASATVNKSVYAHDRRSLVAAGTNPADKRFSVVVVGGLSADATVRAITVLGGRGGVTAEVVVSRPDANDAILIEPAK